MIMWGINYITANIFLQFLSIKTITKSPIFLHYYTTQIFFHTIFNNGESYITDKFLIKLPL